MSLLLPFFSEFIGLTLDPKQLFCTKYAPSSRSPHLISQTIIHHIMQA